MQINRRIVDLTLKNIIMVISYIALLILGILYFEEILKFVGILINVIQPFIIGFVFAFIFNIPNKYFIKKLPIKNEKIKKIIAAILSILLVIAVIIFLIMVILPQVIENITSLINNLPDILKKAEDFMNYWLKTMNASTDLVSTIEKLQVEYGDQILKTVTAWVPKITSWVPSIASGVTQITAFIVKVCMGFMMAVYMLFSKDKLLHQVKKLGIAVLSEKQLDHSLEVIHLTSTTFESFLGGQLIEAIIIGVLCYIGCVILDIPYASIAAVVIGFTNMIPYFGPIIGAVISSILIVLVSPIKALIFLIFSSILQQVESNLIYPHVVGNSVGLSALWVLFAVSVGGGLFGIMGMVFGLPTFSVIYELLRRWTNKRIEKKNKLKKLAEEVVE